MYISIKSFIFIKIMFWFKKPTTIYTNNFVNIFYAIHQIIDQNICLYIEISTYLEVYHLRCCFPIRSARKCSRMSEGRESAACVGPSRES